MTHKDLYDMAYLFFTLHITLVLSVPAALSIYEYFQPLHMPFPPAWNVLHLILLLITIHPTSHFLREAPNEIASKLGFLTFFLKSPWLLFLSLM